MTAIQVKAGAILSASGKVSFVGVGPGDAGLLTRRAAELLRQADVVIADRQAFGAIIDDLCDSEVRVFDAPRGTSDCRADYGHPVRLGRRGDVRDPFVESTIELVLAQEIRDGARVVRLLAGDGLFDDTLQGELAACHDRGITYELVPGISLVSTVPMYAGWPLSNATGASVRVIDLNRAQLKHCRQAPDPSSALILRGRSELIASAVPDLQIGGYPRDAVIDVVSHAATLRQKSIRSTLGRLVRDIRGLPRDQELVAVIGTGIEFDGATEWFEGRALFGWNILAPTTQLGLLPDPDYLTGHGAMLTTVPTIVVGPPRTDMQINRSIRGLVTGRYQWVGLTSPYAVRAIRDRLAGLGLDVRALAGVKVAVVPGETAEAVRDWGIEPDLVGPGPGTKELLDVWPRYNSGSDPLNGVLLPRAEIATESFVEGLVKRGWDVDNVVACRTMRAAPPAESIRDAIKHGEFDAVILTSAACARNLVGIAGKPHSCTVIACIGPATAEAAVELGLQVDVVAPEPTCESLLDALVQYAEQRRTADIIAGRGPGKPSERRRARRNLNDRTEVKSAVPIR